MQPGIGKRLFIYFQIFLQNRINAHQQEGIGVILIDHRAVHPPYKNVFYEPRSGAVVMKGLSGASRVSIAKSKVKVVSNFAVVKN